MRYQFSKTTSGEYFNQLSLAGAQRALPSGRKVRGTNLNHYRDVIMKINDRTSCIDGLIIDLSRSAFSSIDVRSGMIKEGILINLPPA